MAAQSVLLCVTLLYLVIFRVNLGFTRIGTCAHHIGDLREVSRGRLPRGYREQGLVEPLVLGLGPLIGPSGRRLGPLALEFSLRSST